MSVRLVVTDDHPIMRQALAGYFSRVEEMEVVGQASNGREAVELVDQLLPDVVLMDIRMPILDGLGATEKIMAAHTEARILVLTTFDLDEYVHAALRAGASGFMLKDAGPTELLAAIRAVRDGDSVVAPSATRRLIERFIPRQGEGAPTMTDPKLIDSLSDREREVLTCVGEGLTNTEIAERLYLAETTVKTHVGHILSKLNLRDRVSMVITAYDAGLVRPGR